MTPDQPGYATDTATVALGSRDARADFPVKADKTTCVAPGYAYPVRADFEGWTGTRNGWTVVDHGSSGNAWEFGDPHQQWNFTGGSGDFAAVDPYDNNGTAEDADLLSPALDLTHETDDHLRFGAGFAHADGSEADVPTRLCSTTRWVTSGAPSPTPTRRSTAPAAAAAGSARSAAVSRRVRWSTPWEPARCRICPASGSAPTTR